MFEVVNEYSQNAVIKVIGVGGGGDFEIGRASCRERV